MLFYLGSYNQIEKPSFDFKHYCPSLVIIGPWYNTKICSRLYASLFEDYVTTDKHYIYDLIWSSEAHELKHKYVNDEASSGGVRPVQFNSSEDSLI